ncbi:MAG: hypothetical protein ACRCUT_10880 [Spirochaetota bacterium]
MNALEKILAPVINAINGIFDGLPDRTKDMIRQTYIFIIVAICIAGVIIGVTMGKKAAKKTGIQMAETTNRIFDLDIRQSRDEGQFSSLLESESAREMEMKDAPKEAAPAKEAPFAEDSARIAEPERDRHIKTTPDALERRSLPPVPRLDETDPFLDNDVKRIEPAASGSSKGEIVDKPAAPVIEQKSTTADEVKKSSDDIRGPVKSGLEKKKKLIPMEKKATVTE